MNTTISRVVLRLGERWSSVAQVNKATVMNYSAKAVHLVSWSQTSFAFLEPANNFVIVPYTQPWEIVGVSEWLKQQPCFLSLACIGMTIEADELPLRTYVSTNYIGVKLSMNQREKFFMCTRVSGFHRSAKPPLKSSLETTRPWL